MNDLSAEKLERIKLRLRDLKSKARIDEARYLLYGQADLMRQKEQLTSVKEHSRQMMHRRLKLTNP